MRRQGLLFVLLLTIMLVLACGAPTPTTPSPKLKVGVVLDNGGEEDKAFNEYTLKGTRDGADAFGLDFAYLVSSSGADSEQSIEQLILEGANLIVTTGFLLGDVTAKAAQRHSDVSFAIIDYAYLPGIGCPASFEDCYAGEGGLHNVTSLMFREDEVSYLAGVLAGCMSKTGVIASVSGKEIPPVIRWVTGYQNGARWVNPNIVTLNQYIPDFDDIDGGKVAGQEFITQGADVIFGVGGNTGNGGLLAAKEAGIMGIGVDVDQYYTFPEVQSILLTSASKNLYNTAYRSVEDFAAGNLLPGIRLSTLENGGLGLTPFHDWEEKIPQACKDKVKEAEINVRKDRSITGAGNDL